MEKNKLFIALALIGLVALWLYFRYKSQEMAARVAEAQASAPKSTSLFDVLDSALDLGTVVFGKKEESKDDKKK